MRLKKLRTKLKELELEGVLISQPENRYYLSGFSGSFGFLLILSQSALLLTDFCHLEQVKKETRGFEVVRIKGEISQWIKEVVGGQGIRRLGIESHDISLDTYQRMREVLEGIEVVPIRGLVEKMRAVKDKNELGLIQRAVKLSDEAMEYLIDHIHPGMEEREVAWLAERHLRESGSQPLPFEVIVASGLNSAMPHARPTNRVIDSKTPIVIDLGARVEGYCSDLTRTFFLGNSVPPTFHRAYQTVLAAQQEAIANIKVGMSGREADKIARTIVEQAGYGDAFGHGLGHGVGLSPHEAPRLGPDSEDVLEEGMVFTIEPGIYLPDWGGIRVEDVVVLEKKGARVLSQAKKR